MLLDPVPARLVAHRASPTPAIKKGLLGGSSSTAKSLQRMPGPAPRAPLTQGRIPLSRWIIGAGTLSRKFATRPGAPSVNLMDPTRPTVPTRMKRSRKTALLLMGSAPLLLVACAQQPGVETSEGLFTSVEACASETMNPGMCREAFEAAQAQADEVAPRYASREECEAEFGEGQCATRQHAGGSFVGPLMAGFVLSQMMGPRGGAMAPAPAPAAGARPAAAAAGGARATPAFLSNQSGWLRPQAGPGGATALARTSLQPNRAPTVSRGGFGRSGAGRSAGG